MSGRALAVFLVATSVALALADRASSAREGDDFARFASGLLPRVSPLAPAEAAVSAVILEVDAAGKVTASRALFAPSPLTDALTDASASWRFRPASRSGRAESTSVLVAAVSGVAAVAGTSPLSEDVALGVPADAPRNVPVPTRAKLPAFPPTAFVAGTVLVEVEIDREGAVGAARITASSPALDHAALAAARNWSFQPAERDGRPVDALAYVLFAFREPVTPTEKR